MREHPYRNVAQVLKPHGSKGEVVAAPLRGLPFVLVPGLSVCLTPPALDRRRWTKVVDASPFLDGYLVSFDGISDLSDAEGISGCMVLVRTADVELGPLDVAYDDLLGRRVVDERYGDLGRIKEVMTGPANDVWVVEGDAYGEVLLPVIPSVIPAIPERGPVSVRALDGLIG